MGILPMKTITFEEAKKIYFEIAGDSGRYNAAAAKKVFEFGVVLNNKGLPYKSFRSFANSMNYCGNQYKRRRVSKGKKDFTGV